MRPVGRDAAAVQEIPLSPSVSAYCRQARRLRGTLAHQPARMHRRLRELAVATASVARADARLVSASPDSGPGPSTAHAFAKQVAAGMDGPVLRYATRRRLISDARRLGIGNFEANLIIAAVLHERRRAGEPTAPAVPTQTGARAWSVASLVVVIAVEALVALGVWQIWVA